MRMRLLFGLPLKGTYGSSLTPPFSMGLKGNDEFPLVWDLKGTTSSLWRVPFNNISPCRIYVEQTPYPWKQAGIRHFIIHVFFFCNPLFETEDDLQWTRWISTIWNWIQTEDHCADLDSLYHFSDFVLRRRLLFVCINRLLIPVKAYSLICLYLESCRYNPSQFSSRPISLRLIDSSCKSSTSSDWQNTRWNTRENRQWHWHRIQGPCPCSNRCINHPQ
jgi:hypothetical protein